MQGYTPVITTQAQARVWNFISKGEEFFSARLWPAWLVDLALKPHKNNRDRFNFFFFLVANGMDHFTAGTWTLMNDVRVQRTADGRFAPAVYSSGYDDHAVRQIRQMKQQLRDGTFFQGKKKMIDLAQGKVVEQ